MNRRETRRAARRTTAALAAGLLLLAGCGKGERSEPPATGAARFHAPAVEGATLYLAQAQFLRETGPDGKSRSVPGPARLGIWTRSRNGWTEEVIEDDESNVFHKAAWFEPPDEAPGILTIGATEAHLKIWRKNEGRWEAESLWNPTFGGKWDRLRDFEVGDVTGDGADDIVIATHDMGVVAVVSRMNGAWHAEELSRRPETFVHEIELGDVDGDGTIEIFATPSKPNKLDGTPQPGEIDMWKRSGDGWAHRVVDSLEKRHAKEILCVTLTGETRPVLLTSLEGENIGGSGPGDNTRIRLYRFEGETIEKSDIAGLPGKLCRFLTFGDIDGDGRSEVIASTKSSGIWRLSPPADGPSGEWVKSLIAAGTSGFEHATYLYDFDGDGKDEIYVASDDQGELRCYWFEKGEFRMEKLGALSGKPITFNVTAHKM